MTIAQFVNKVLFKVDDQSVNRVNDTVKSIKNTATKLLGAIGVGISLTAINGLVEEFTRVNNQIRNATESLGDQRGIQKEILAAAERLTAHKNAVTLRVAALQSQQKEKN